METLRSNCLTALVAQLLRGPKRLRLRQLHGIEFLLSLIEQDRDYPYDFVCHALTGFRPGADANLTRLMAGEDLIPDLVAIAEELSTDGDLLAERWPERVFTVHELAERFDVSTKTVFRWRRRGLAGWKFRCSNGQRFRLLFPERCVRRFVAQNADLVSRGSSFSQLSSEERQQIVVRAQALVSEGQRTVNAVARTIAAETGRAVETIRLILKHHDEAHPRAGVFNRSPLRVEADDQRLAVWEAYVDGATVEALAERFERPIAWIYKTITQMRARELRARRIEYVGSPEFDEAAADERILHAAPTAALRQPLSEASRRVPAGLPPYLAGLFQIPLLTREGEQYLFRKMNYLKHRAARLVEQLDPESARPVELDAIESLLEQAGKVKSEIVQANLRLVVSIAKRHLHSGQELFEIISDGNISLMRAVDKFDYTRGFKFSTYASWAVMKNFARSIPEERRHGERYQTGWDEMLDTVGTASQEDGDNEHQSAVRGALDRMLATLDSRERSILRQRYGLDDGGEPQTLEQIGRRMGVSKERVRQLEARAMLKLRGGFEADVQQLLGA